MSISEPSSAAAIAAAEAAAATAEGVAVAAGGVTSTADTATASGVADDAAASGSGDAVVPSSSSMVAALWIESAAAGDLGEGAAWSAAAVAWRCAGEATSSSAARLRLFLLSGVWLDAGAAPCTELLPASSDAVATVDARGCGGELELWEEGEGEGERAAAVVAL